MDADEESTKNMKNKYHSGAVAIILSPSARSLYESNQKHITVNFGRLISVSIGHSDIFMMCAP